MPIAPSARRGSSSGSPRGRARARAAIRTRAAAEPPTATSNRGATPATCARAGCADWPPASANTARPVTTTPGKFASELSSETVAPRAKVHVRARVQVVGPGGGSIAAFRRSSAACLVRGQDAAYGQITGSSDQRAGPAATSVENPACAAAHAIRAAGHPRADRRPGREDQQVDGRRCLDRQRCSEHGSIRHRPVTSNRSTAKKTSGTSSR